ncbi:uncharacterized protein BKA55DRAFT_535915 [Fusarium redolens]|uniref:Uncharacterized protein n=1 Tax=Fusarium redolens TaxID=48865 RepID=A0A9P9KKY4_FUSRE|nr:uncharacterized protein BKA55DRAFT_535915 [Fusarium redolens]KAH7260906.1 hypothetical protein BKA55DRAFT_535915 [Fusarium redolens]
MVTYGWMIDKRLSGIPVPVIRMFFQGIAQLATFPSLNAYILDVMHHRSGEASADEFDVRMVDVGKMPALLTLPGEENGLSRPLSFDSIKNRVEKIVSKTTAQYENSPINWAGLANLFRAQARRGLIQRFIQNGLEMLPKKIRTFMKGWRKVRDGVFFFGLLD